MLAVAVHWQAEAKRRRMGGWVGGGAQAEGPPPAVMAYRFRCVYPMGERRLVTNLLATLADVHGWRGPPFGDGLEARDNMRVQERCGRAGISAAAAAPPAADNAPGVRGQCAAEGGGPESGGACASGSAGPD